VSKHVIIYIPLISEETVQWAVSDDSGKLTTDVEYSTLAEVAAEVEGRKVTIVLPADEVLLSEAIVPGGSVARAQQAVPFALEDVVADDVDTLHFALGSKGPEDAYPVAVVTALLDQDQIIVRLNGQQGFATDPGMASIMIDGARQSMDNETDPSLVIFRTDPPVDLALPDNIDVEMRDCEHRLALYASGLARSPHINLLQGVYNPKKNFDKTWKPWRATAGLAACLCVALFIGKWADVRALDKQAAALDAEIAGAFKQASNCIQPGHAAANRIENHRI